MFNFPKEKAEIKFPLKKKKHSYHQHDKLFNENLKYNRKILKEFKSLSDDTGKQVKFSRKIIMFVLKNKLNKTKYDWQIINKERNKQSWQTNESSCVITSEEFN